ncbi:MAG: pyruvate dehydrogenase (acetyl-transferring), homodimeric type, partial [Betaproteobacteria bacterium]|nr:pyruvate dehydrogenase (acetyl-transferring), homodimeric type [Betaproteobacteria bacterium]
LKGASLFQTFGKGGKDLTLLASGAVMTEAQAASERLASEGYTVHLVSVTSYTQLARDAEVSRSSGALQSSHLHALLARTKGPLVALSDYVRLLPEQIRAYLPEGRSLSVLGTDGFGCSDSRAALRRHFGVDAQAIVSLVRGGLPQ